MNYLLLIRIAKYGLIVIICALFFRFMMRLKNNSKETEKRMEHSIEARLKSDGRYAYQKQKLSSLGIMYRQKNYNLEPSKYIMIRLFSGCTLAAVYVLLKGISLIPILVAILIGYVLCDVYYKQQNSKDNEAILPDLFNIHLTLKIQLSSNVYISEALQASKNLVRNERLQEAMNELLMNLSNKSRPYLISVDIFESRFNSPEISNFCNFLRSYVKYGVTERYLEDIMDEINEISTNISMREEHDMDSKTGIISFFFFAGIIAMIGYGIFYTMLNVNIFG